MKQIIYVCILFVLSEKLFSESNNTFSICDAFISLQTPVYVSFVCDSNGVLAKDKDPNSVSWVNPSFNGEYIIDELGRQVLHINYKTPTDVNANYSRVISKDNIMSTYIPSRKLLEIGKQVVSNVGSQSFMDYVAKVPDDDFTYPAKTFSQLLQLSSLKGNKLSLVATESGFKATIYVDKRDAVDKRIKIMDMYVFDFIGSKIDKTLMSVQHRFLLTDFLGNEIISPVISEYIYSDFVEIKGGVKIPKKVVYNMNVIDPNIDEHGKILSVMQKRVFWQTISVKEVSTDRQKIAEKSTITLPKGTKIMDKINSTVLDIDDIMEKLKNEMVSK